MTLRSQACLCFAAAAVATLGFPRGPTYKYVLAAIAMMIGVSLWQRDKRQRAARAVRLARIEAAEAASAAADEERSS